MIIGLMGAKGVGKSSVAAYLLKHHGHGRRAFAGPLKRMLASIGLTERQLYGDEKEVPLDLLCGKTPRHAMQTLGTEWRDMIGTNLWTLLMEQDIVENGLKNIVIDDVRFDHEVEMVRALGGRVWLIRRPEVEPEITPKTHASEVYWSVCRPDVSVMNTGTLEELYPHIDLLMKESPIATRH